MAIRRGVSPRIVTASEAPDGRILGIRLVARLRPVLDCHGAASPNSKQKKCRFAAQYSVNKRPLERLLIALGIVTRMGRNACRFGAMGLKPAGFIRNAQTLKHSNTYTCFNFSSANSRGLQIARPIIRAMPPWPGLRPSHNRCRSADKLGHNRLAP